MEVKFRRFFITEKWNGNLIRTSFLTVSLPDLGLITKFQKDYLRLSNENFLLFVNFRHLEEKYQTFIFNPSRARRSSCFIIKSQQQTHFNQCYHPSMSI